MFFEGYRLLWFLTQNTFAEVCLWTFAERSFPRVDSIIIYIFRTGRTIWVSRHCLFMMEMLITRVKKERVRSSLPEPKLLWFRKGTFLSIVEHSLGNTNLFLVQTIYLWTLPGLEEAQHGLRRKKKKNFLEFSRTFLNLWVFHIPAYREISFFRFRFHGPQWYCIPRL